MSLFSALESFEDGTGKPTIIGEDANIQMTTDGDSVNSPETLDKEKLAVAKAQGDLEKENEKIAEVVEAIDALESYRQLLSKSLETGGADALTHRAIAIGVESLLSNLADVEAFSKVASMEGIDTPRGQINATNASIEAITASMEGLLDKVKDFISKAVKGFKALFSKLGDLLQGYEGMAKKYKQRLSSATMKTEPISFKQAGALLKDGKVSTKALVESTIKFKKDMLDSGEYNKHWEAMVKILNDKNRNPDDVLNTIRHSGLKLPSYFEKGDKFGTLKVGSLPGDVTPYTWAISDSYGFTIAVREGANKVASPYALSMAKGSMIADYNDPVDPLSKKDAEAICDTIIEYCKAFRSIQKPIFMTMEDIEDVQNGTLEAGRAALARRTASNESFIGDTIDTFKQGWERFNGILAAILAFWGANNFIMVGTHAVHPIAAVLSSWTGIGTFVNATAVDFGYGLTMGAAIKSTLVNTLFTALGVAVIIFMVSLLIVAVRGAMSRGEKVDPSLQEDYEAYVKAYANLTDTQKAALPDPNDLDKAIANTENKEYQQHYNVFISQFGQLITSSAVDYYTEFNQFAFGVVGELFDSAMVHVRESIAE